MQGLRGQAVWALPPWTDPASSLPLLCRGSAGRSGPHLPHSASPHTLLRTPTFSLPPPRPAPSGPALSASPQQAGCAALSCL